MNKLVIIGAGGHGNVVAFAAEESKRYCEIVFIDDVVSTSKTGLKVVGKTKDIEKFVKDYEFIVAIGDNKFRKEISRKVLELGGKLTTIIHPSAVVSKYSSIKEGVFVSANAVINPFAKIEEGAIINTAAVIEHDCKVGEYTHVCPSVSLAGTVSVGSCCTLGIGTKVINNLEISNDVVLGAGSVVVKDIKESGTYVGVPVRKLGTKK